MKEQILAAVQSGFKLDWAISNCTGQFESFYHEAIEYYKAELLKEVGEPTCWMTPDGEGWRMRTKPPETDTKLGWMEFYTSDQLVAAILKATKPLEEEVERLKTVPMKYRRMAFNAQLQDENKELRAKLAAVQEECEFQRNAHKQAEELMLEQGNQLTAAREEIRSREDFIAMLQETQKDQLAKAEQQVAEACADLLVDRFKHEVAGTLAIRQGEWRKFVKEV